MYTNELLDAYKKAKNYIQDKQVAHDLGLSRQKISAIRNGQRYLSENEALFLAKEIGADTESVVECSNVFTNSDPSWKSLAPSPYPQQQVRSRPLPS